MEKKIEELALDFSCEKIAKFVKENNLTIYCYYKNLPKNVIMRISENPERIPFEFFTFEEEIKLKNILITSISPKELKMKQQTNIICILEILDNFYTFKISEMYFPKNSKKEFISFSKEKFLHFDIQDKYLYKDRTFIERFFNILERKIEKEEYDNLYFLSFTFENYSLSYTEYISNGYSFIDIFTCYKSYYIDPREYNSRGDGKMVYLRDLFPYEKYLEMYQSVFEERKRLIRQFFYKW